MITLNSHHPSSSFPDGSPGYCSSYGQKSKGKGPAFLCKLSTEFEKSFLLPSVLPTMEHPLGSDYTDCVRHWRVTDEQMTFSVLQGHLVMEEREPKKPSQHTATNATPADAGELGSESGEEGDRVCL